MSLNDNLATCYDYDYDYEDVTTRYNLAVTHPGILTSLALSFSVIATIKVLPAPKLLPRKLSQI